MASVGKAHSCPSAQSPESKLQINDIVDAGIDDEVVQVRRPNVVAIGRTDRPSWKLNTMLHLDMPNIELGVMCA